MRRFSGSKRLQATARNHDCPILQEHFQPNAWWSNQRTDGVDYAALPLELDGDRCVARFFENGCSVGEFTLPMAGLHNLSNATAALAASRMEGVPFERLVEGLASEAPGVASTIAAPGKAGTSLTITPTIPVR